MKIIHFKSRTIFLLAIVLLALVFLLPSCTVQKRLYRPGYHIEAVRGGNVKTAKPVEEVAAIAVAEEPVTDAGVTAEQQVLVAPNVPETILPKKTGPAQEPKAIYATEKNNTVAIKTMQQVKKAVSNSTKKMHSVNVLTKHATAKKAAGSQGNYGENFGYWVSGIGLALILVTLAFIFNDPLLIVNVLVIGWYIVEILVAIAVIGFLLYALWWIFDFTAGGCGF